MKSVLKKFQKTKINELTNSTKNFFREIRSKAKRRRVDEKKRIFENRSKTKEKIDEKRNVENCSKTKQKVYENEKT